MTGCRNSSTRCSEQSPNRWRILIFAVRSRLLIRITKSPSFPESALLDLGHSSTSRQSRALRPTSLLQRYFCSNQIPFNKVYGPLLIVYRDTSSEMDPRTSTCDFARRPYSVTGKFYCMNIYPRKEFLEQICA